MTGARGLFVCGTDTDAGKTVVTAALARALTPLLHTKGLRPLPVKPVQTGVAHAAAQGADACRYAEALAGLPPVESFVAQGAATGPAFTPRTLHTFALPASPHLAARREGQSLSVAQLAAEIRQVAASEPGAFLLLEGAGGIMVPLHRGASEDGDSAPQCMLDLVQALGWSVLLVARNQLGALNHALLSLRALQQAGIAVAGMVCTRTAPWPEHEEDALILRDNVETLRRWPQAPPVWELPYLPQLADAAAPADTASTAWEAAALALAPAAAHIALLADTDAGDASAENILDWDKRHLWHPYTSATAPLPVLEAVSTQGTRIRLRDGRELVDGMASWWCAVHGYGHPRLVEAARQQAGRMAHVMFGGLTHAPAVELGRKLLPLLPQGLEHIFWADSGSVAVEVALKMALQYAQGREGAHTRRTHMLTVRGGYHGDTLDAMSVCDPVNGMHTLFRGVLPQQIFVPRPSCRFDQPFDPESVRPLREALEAHGQEVAACILEPVVQGAGGMWFYHPEFLRHARELCTRHGVLLILDEIATGFGRTGKLFAAEWPHEGRGITPDICCVGKALTGGFMTLAGTACTAEVARGIGSGGQVFMHGPTFMGNPLACAVASASLDVLMQSDWQADVARLERGLRDGLAPCRGLPGVADVRVLGGIGVVETEQPVSTAALQAFFVQRGVWIRPFNHLIYLMPPYIATEEDVYALTSAVCGAVREGVHLA